MYLLQKSIGRMLPRFANVIFYKVPVPCSKMRYLGKILPRISARMVHSRNFISDKPVIVLGIETSCDDTGCAIVDSNGTILGEAIHSQQIIHLNNGGIIPPLARDLHSKHITEICENALNSANMKLRDVDAVAATVKPGLPLSLLIGTKFGKYLSKIGRKPFIPIHHMEAHALTARMVHKVDFPFLVLLISGGHCLLALVEKVDKFYLLGASIDDAPGEAFDKVARRSKLHNIPDFYDICSGAALEIAATRATDPEQFYFPPSLCQYRDCNFSFSGIKSKAMYHLIKEEKRHNIVGDSIIPDIYNLCAAFQMAISRHICNRTQRAMEYIQLKDLLPKENRTLVVSGGVACNNFIANALNIICSEMGYNLVRPPPKLCTDNGIMIAWNGVEKYMANSDILTNPADIEKVDINQRAPLGENWTERVTEANLKCKWIQIKKLYAK